MKDRGRPIKVTLLAPPGPAPRLLVKGLTTIVTEQKTMVCPPLTGGESAGPGQQQ